MKNNKKIDIKINGKMDIHNTQIHDRSFSGLVQALQ